MMIDIFSKEAKVGEKEALKKISIAAWRKRKEKKRHYSEKKSKLSD